MPNINYTTINHEARMKLGLSMNEYAVADLIYNLSNNPKSDVKGWCYASKITIGNMLGLSEKSIHTILSSLIEKKLIDKQSETRHLKATPSWYETIVIKHTEETSVRLKKGKPLAEESSAQVAEESSAPIYYKDNTNKDNNITPKGVTEFGNSEINAAGKYLLEKLKLPKEDCTQRQSRQYWQHLLRESKSGLTGVRWLIDVASSDEWYRNNIASSKDLYYKRVKLLARRRGGVHEAKSRVSIDVSKL